MLLGSPLTALFLPRPAELDPEVDSTPPTELEPILDVSMVKPLVGGPPLPATSSSTQPAGVGGTGPSADAGGGRRVGGEMSWSVERFMLCDLDCGGGPGGGGGNGIPGSHLAANEYLEGVDVGELMAPAEDALRAAGGLSMCSASISTGCVSIETGCGLRGGVSRLISGERRGGSGAGRRVKAAKLNTDRSLEPARERVVGGGAKTGAGPGSGEDRYPCAGGGGGARAAGELVADGSSIIDAR
jgi:hypothetical protein